MNQIREALSGIRGKLIAAKQGGESDNSLGQRLGVSGKTISNIIAERHAPTIDTLRKIELGLASKSPRCSDSGDSQSFTRPVCEKTHKSGAAA